jgi:hypothetical protein
MRWVLVLAEVAACGGGRGEREAERAPLEPVAAAEPVRVELAWVVSAAPTEVKEVECKLVLRVVRPGGDEKGEMHELGVWWRAQQGVIEVVEVTSARGAVLFRTEAAFGAEGDLTRAPAFEVVREPGGAVVVRGKDEDTPWRQIERVEIPATTPVEAAASR